MKIPGSISNFYVLIIRPEPGASETEQILIRSKIPCLKIPLSHVRHFPLKFPAKPVQALVVTSRQALVSLPSSLHALPLFAVGKTTAEIAYKQGFLTVIEGGGNDEKLMACLLHTLIPENGPLLQISGKKQGVDLKKKLQKNHFSVLRRVVYENKFLTSFPPALLLALQQKKISHFLFFSQESATAFIRLAKKYCLEESFSCSVAISVSEKAAEPLKNLPFSSVRIAAEPTGQAVTERIYD